MMVTVSAVALRKYVEDLLLAAGCADSTAAMAAEVFIEADLRGHAIQGIDHIHTTLEALLSGRIDGYAEAVVVQRRSGTIQVDGRRGLGQPAAILAVDEAALAARRLGCGAAAVVNADDVYMLGYYVERLARAGLVGMALICTWPPRVRHPDGLDPVVGTNPIAIGIPLGFGDPIVFDFTASSLAIGKVRMAAYHKGQLLPEGIAFGVEGSPTREPSVALHGSLVPESGQAGFVLLIMSALVGGALSGGSVGEALNRELAGGSTGRGNLFIALDPSAFAGKAAFNASASVLLDAIGLSPNDAAGQEHRLPGRRSFDARADALERGVAVDPVSWQRTKEYAALLGVRVPNVSA